MKIKGVGRKRHCPQEM